MIQIIRTRKLHMSLGDRNRWSNVQVLFTYYVRKQPWRKMSEWIHRYNLLLISPLYMRSNVRRRLRVLEIRPVI